jgi:hypothetical protein
MGSMVTRPGITRHAYGAGGPVRVAAHGVTASAMSMRAGEASIMPVSQPVATFASDGAPFYNSGYVTGYPSVALPGGEVGLALPPRAAQLDLTDRQSWDRPVIWPGSR